MLKLAGENEVQEKVELISYIPTIKDTGDLEAGTATIVPTSRPAIGSAQYSASLTLPAPSDARLAVLRIAARLSVNIVSLGTATHVYCSVRVDVDDADHELFNLDWTSAGPTLTTIDTHSSYKATIFNLLKGGTAHTFYFLFWADVASQANIDIVELWYGVGTNSTSSGAAPAVLQLSHTGFAQTQIYGERAGTGSMTGRLGTPVDTYVSFVSATGGGINLALPCVLVGSGLALALYGTVATDINCFYRGYFAIRSEQ